jgi:hypothetical protein
MEVSRSVFYDSQRHQPSRGELDDEALSEWIAETRVATRGVYGWPRVECSARPRPTTCEPTLVCDAMQMAIDARRRRETDSRTPLH